MNQTVYLVMNDLGVAGVYGTRSTAEEVILHLTMKYETNHWVVKHHISDAYC